MAKQIGAMPISGKIDNLVYYNTKNGGAVVRRAYPNLGKRVKTDKVYANTRRNNAEFGMCGYVASQLLSPILQRWKYILKPDAVGDLTKTLVQLLPLSQSNIWGERTLLSDENLITPIITNKIQSLCKNNDYNLIYNRIKDGQIEVNFSGNYLYFILDSIVVIDESTIEKYRTIGANSINFYVGVLSQDYPMYNSYSKRYIFRDKRSHISSPFNFAIPSGTNTLEISLNTNFPDNGYYPYADDSSCCGGVLVCVIPVKSGQELVEFGTYGYAAAPTP